jgi:hypothetical protein
MAAFRNRAGLLGLLAGREIAMSVRLRARPLPETLRLIGGDGARVFVGLAVSVLLAVALPRLGALGAPAGLASSPTAPIASAGVAAPALSAARRR